MGDLQEPKFGLIYSVEMYVWCSAKQNKILKIVSFTPLNNKIEFLPFSSLIIVEVLHNQVFFGGWIELFFDTYSIPVSLSLNQDTVC